MMYKTERLRFAPSPTGDLHIGGARAALFNWLYARNTGGKFLLRIEDTDRERSTEQSLTSILDSLTWLGLSWDEPPVKQSKRGHIYREVLEKLLTSGAAYRCFCRKDELEAESERARREKLPYHYSGKCRNLDEATVSKYLAEDRPYAVRFRVPAGLTTWTDLVHGETTYDNGEFGDFIIARTDGSPVYILAVAADDADMGITLVMRGDDHLTNTPKQIMLMNALGTQLPRYAHLPQVLGEDKKKLSKRHGAASVIEYRNMGFLPEAVVNFLALLGWNPGDDREKMTVEELISAFSLVNISKKSGVFDMAKLEWLNGQYLNDLPPERLVEAVTDEFVARGYIDEAERAARRDYILTLIVMLKERCRVITDFGEKASYFFVEPDSYDEKGEKKHFKPEAAQRLIELADSFERLAQFTVETTEEATRVLVEKYGVGAGKYIHPTRLAVSGTTAGPGLFEMLAAVGKERTIVRMRRAIARITKQL